MATLVKLDDHILNLDHVIEAQFFPAHDDNGEGKPVDVLYLRLDGVKVDGSALGPDELRIKGDRAVRWWEVLCYESGELIEVGGLMEVSKPGGA